MIPAEFFSIDEEARNFSPGWVTFNTDNLRHLAQTFRIGISRRAPSLSRENWRKYARPVAG